MINGKDVSRETKETIVTIRCQYKGPFQKHVKEGTIKPQELANIKDSDTFMPAVPVRVLGSL